MSHRLSARISRRRALASAGASVMGAAFLAACGGGSSDTKPKEQASSLVAQTVDETKNVQRGGTFKNFSTRDIPAFEPHSFAAASITVVAPCYSNLWRVQEGYTTQTSGEIVGDLVESWEFSPDKTTLTAKLHQGAHFSPQAPTNGRVVDAQDVLFSWNRIKAISTRRGELANDIDPNAPITSITAPDDKTIVIKMKEPTGTILALLSTAIQGLMIIAPKEGADTKVLNLATTVRGSGPWYLDQQTPGARYTFKRNPGFQQDKRNLPYIDEIEWPVVPEYAQVMAQFRTGSIYAFTTARAEDILPLKQDIPELVVMGTDFQTPLPRPYFGVQASSSFKDPRVRQAFAMTWDRDLFIDTVYNVSKFKSQGVNIDTAWELALQSNTWKDWMLDGRDKNFGPNAKFFKKDVAEAKKLMSAAGFNSVLTVDNNTPTGVVNQAAFDQAIDIITGMAEESGLFKLTRKLSNFNTDFIPRFQDAKGNFDGMAYTLSSLTIDPYNYLKSYYHPSGAQRQGTDDTFRDLIDKAGKEFDDKKRQAILHDVQRHEAETMFFPRIGAATGLQIFWPALRNVNVWQGGSGRPNATLFLDPTKAPLKRA